MRFAPWAGFAAAFVCALVLAVDKLAEPGAPGSSANRTAYSFLHAVNHGNQGRGCSWTSEDWRDANCPPAGTWRITDRAENPDGSVRYTFTSPEAFAPAHVTVVEHANGRWRVDRVD